MSLILDALRRAEAQRERESVRGIQAQPLPVLAGSADAGPGSRLGWWLGGAALALAAALALWWAWPGTETGRATLSAAPPAAPLPAATPPAAPGLSLPPQAAITPPPPAPALMPTPTPALPQQSAPQAVAPAARTGAVPVRAAASTPAATTATAAPVLPAASAASAPPASAPRAMVATEGILPLSPEVQAAMPRLAISGGTYSENPAQRMLIVNGQVWTEGSEPAAGVTLEQIRPGSAVLRFRGLRYAVTY